MEMDNPHVFQSKDDEKLNNVPDPFHSRLEIFENLSTIATESTVEIWQGFLSLWCDILQISASEIVTSYNRCARLIPKLIKSTSFYTIRKDSKIARETCFMCLNQLNQSSMKNYFLLSVDEQKLAENEIYYEHIYHLLFIASQSASFIPFAAIEDQQFIENHSELLILFIERVDKRMPQHSLTDVENNYSLGTINERILNFLWNLSDRTVIIPTLLRCNLAERVVNWLSQSAVIKESSRRPFISIVHNIARHDDGADQLNQFNAIPAIQIYQKMFVQFSRCFSLDYKKLFLMKI